MIDNIIIFTSLLVVTGIVLKIVIKYIDSHEKNIRHLTKK